MTTKARTRHKEETRELGCRANEREEILITHAAKLDRRPRNSFIIAAATAAARVILQANGVEEESLFARPAERGIRNKRVAA